LRKSYVEVKVAIHLGKQADCGGLRILQAWLWLGLVHGSPTGGFLLGLACFLVLLCSGVVSISTRFTSPDTLEINTLSNTCHLYIVLQTEIDISEVDIRHADIGHGLLIDYSLSFPAKLHKLIVGNT
jgi:hypothetical protein